MHQSPRKIIRTTLTTALSRTGGDTSAIAQTSHTDYGIVGRGISNQKLRLGFSKKNSYDESSCKPLNAQRSFSKEFNRTLPY